MSEPTSPKRAGWLPDTSSGFWRFCLLASLMLNLIVVGLIAGPFAMRWSGRDMMGPQRFAQFVPREFVRGLTKERRQDLMAGFRGARGEMDQKRKDFDANALKLAHELSSTTYDAAKLGAVVDSFTIGPDSLAAKGGFLLKDFIAKLTPEERANLAKSIQQRSAARRL